MMDYKDDYRGFANLVAYFYRMPPVEGRFSVPTLIVTGDQDDIVSPKSAQELYEMSPPGSVPCDPIEGGEHGLLNCLPEAIQAGIDFSERHEEPLPRRWWNISWPLPLPRLRNAA